MIQFLLQTHHTVNEVLKIYEIVVYLRCIYFFDSTLDGEIKEDTFCRHAFRFYLNFALLRAKLIPSKLMKLQKKITSLIARIVFIFLFEKMLKI